MTRPQSKSMFWRSFPHATKAGFLEMLQTAPNVFSAAPGFAEVGVWILEGRLGSGDVRRSILIKEFPFQIGRRTGLSLSLACSAVSSLHAELDVRDGSLIVRDLKSTNGTYVNGNRVANETVLKDGDLIQVGRTVMRAHRGAKAVTQRTVNEDVYDQAFALTQFDRLMSDRAVVPYFQPIVTLDEHGTLAFEVLGRSRLFGLRSPREMFLAAAQLNCEAELSRLLRLEAVKLAASLNSRSHLFLNTHPFELDNVDELIKSLAELREITDQPITLEIHEATVTNVAAMRSVRDALNDFQMGLAYDDFGAGQTRLIEIAEVTPDYLKFDIKLIQNIHAASAERKQMLETLVRMARDLGIVTLAEGVEREDESDTCRELGFELGQGYLYGRPADGSYLASTTEN